MSIIRKRNPITGEWETFSVTSASEMPILDIKDNFTSKNVEGALRELSDKNTEINSKVSAQSTAISEHSSTLRVHAEDIAWLKENGGGGGGGTSAPTITSKFEDGTIVQKGEDVKIPIFFTSPNQGNGIAYIVIDGIEVASVEGIKQGNNTINIGKLSKLRNNVAIYVKDRTNALSNQLEWTIICGGIDLEVNFDDTADYGVTDQIVMQFTVTSASTEPIIMHMTIDYDTYEVECTQGVNEYMFVGLGVGVHKVSFYLTSGEYRTNTVNYNIVVVNSNSLFISSSFEEGQFIYGTPVAVQYRVSKASDEYFEVKLYLNDVLQKTLSVQAGTYYWTINDVEIGNHNIRIEVRSAYNEEFIINKTFEVVAGNYTPLKITEAGLIYRLNAKGRTNQDSDRAEPRDNSGNGIAARLYNFNWYTNGWIDDELVCDSNAYVEIDCYPWSENAIYGSTIEVQYTGLDIGFNEARIFDYTDVETPYKGVYIDLEESTMKSLANTGKVNVDKDVETTLTFVIDRKNKFGKIYVDGICSRAFSLSDTGSGTSAVREDFTHTQKIYLNSRKGLDKFGACKIKDIRIYSRVLSDDEIVQNNIAQVTDLAAQEKLYKLNYENTTLPTIKMYGDTTNMTLETPVTMRIKYTSPNEDKYGQSFDLPYCTVNWQGTSSLQYVLKNFTARLKDENMADYYYTPYSNGVLENVYCFKCDYMESTHSRNVGLAKFVNDCLYDTKNPAQQKDDKIRNSIAGFPCLLYINDELQGVYNFNLDRYSTRPFGYTDPDKCIVYEVSANSDTTAGAFYKWSEASGKSQLDYYKSDFECLYPPTRAAGNDNMSELIRLIEWVNDSSDEDFKDNIGRYFNLEYLLRYYLFVLVFGAVDSLGKNMKLATWDGLVWYPQVYDADTTIGLDNTGFLKFDMDIEMGDENVFNTTGSQLWKKVVLLFDAELKAQYSLMRQDRFTVDNIMKYLYGEQISQIPAYYYNKDMQSKYLNFGSSYLYALHGSGEQHIRKWIRERLMYCDTLLGYRASSSDYITLRSSKLGEVYLDVETYIPMYLSIKWRDEANNTGLQTKRVSRGEKVRFTYNMPTATDQEIIVYAGHYLKSLGDVSNLQPTSMLIANADRLTEIECHSPNLINTDLSECTKLQRIDLSDCTALGTGIGAQPILNIQNCKYLRYCNCLNTQLTAIYTMQAGGNLEEIYYPKTTQVVQLTNQTYLHTVGIPYGYNSMLKTTKIVLNRQYYDYCLERDVEGFTSFVWDDFIEVDNSKKYIIRCDSNYQGGNHGLNGTRCYYYAFDENKNLIKGAYPWNTAKYMHDAYWGGGRLNFENTVTFDSNVKYIKAGFNISISADDTSTLKDRLKNGGLIAISKSITLYPEGETAEFEYCKNLANIQITNCNAIEKLQYPYLPGEHINFDAFKYVQNLNITNSLSGLNSIHFNGFDKMRNVTLSSLHELENIGFEDMLPVSTTSTLKNITISDCPLITSLSFNVSSDDYKVAFASGGKLDLGGVQSLKTIECNTSIKGLKTLVVPTSLKELKFYTEYGDGINDITNIWSASAVHDGDDFEGLDFLDMSIDYINMAGLSKLTNGINFNLSPVDQPPNLNITKDGSETKPYFRPSGKINLDNYVGDITGLLKGIDLSKFIVEINNDREQTDLTSLFEDTIGCNTDKINRILAKFPNSVTWSYLLKGSDISTPITIPTDRPMVLTGMYKDSSVTTDTDLPTNVTDVSEMYMNCINTTELPYKNWEKTYDDTIVTTDCYKGSGTDLDEVPDDWGGYAFFKTVTSVLVFEIPSDNYTLTLNDQLLSTFHGNNDYSKYKRVSWGDGTITEGEISHTYATAGTYTLKGHYYMGQWEPTASIKETLIEIKQIPKYYKWGTSHRYIATNCTKLKKVTINDYIANDNDNGLLSAFNGCTALEEVYIKTTQQLDKGITLQSAFQGCSSLKTVTIIGFKSKNCSRTFEDCSSLTEIIGLDTWNMSNCTSIYRTFARCNVLGDNIFLTISEWDVTKVTGYNETFLDCKAMTNNNFMSSWEMSNCSELGGTFQGCTGLIELDLSNKFLTGLNNIRYLCADCTNLQTINLTNLIDKDNYSGILPTNLYSCENPFNNCTSLQNNPYLQIGIGLASISFWGLTCVPDILDLSEIDTSTLQSFRPTATATQIIGINSNVPWGMTFRFSPGITVVKDLYYKHGNLDFHYYSTPAPNLFINFVTKEGSTAYKSENFGPLGTYNSINNVLKLSSTNYNVNTFISLFNCLYDYASEGGSANYTLVLGSANLAKLTDEQKAIATNKGWTLA